MNQVGGSDWETFRGKMETLLTKNQRNDGSWGYPPNSQEPGYAGPVFPTAMAVLTLSARYKVLPIYQSEARSTKHEIRNKSESLNCKF
jgi:hypothetical protein